ncbi:MAG: hypothetical protein ACRDYC_10885 [Acidimicrobiales bacterium]
MIRGLRSRPALLGACALAAALSLAGCGQGADTESLAPPPTGFQPHLSFQDSSTGPAVTSTFEADGAWQIQWKTFCVAGEGNSITLGAVRQDGEVYKEIRGDPTVTSKSGSGTITYHSGVDDAVMVTTNCPWSVSVYTYPNGGQSQ